jgi:hypothetical protein
MLQQSRFLGYTEEILRTTEFRRGAELCELCAFSAAFAVKKRSS